MPAVRKDHVRQLLLLPLKSKLVRNPILNLNKAVNLVIQSLKVQRKYQLQQKRAL